MQIRNTGNNIGVKSIKNTTFGHSLVINATSMEPLLKLQSKVAENPFPPIFRIKKFADKLFKAIIITGKEEQQINGAFKDLETLRLDCQKKFEANLLSRNIDTHIDSFFSKAERTIEIHNNEDLPKHFPKLFEAVA
jgi:hypothetical protein